MFQAGSRKKKAKFGRLILLLVLIALAIPASLFLISTTPQQSRPNGAGITSRLFNPTATSVPPTATPPPPTATPLPTPTPVPAAPGFWRTEGSQIVDSNNKPVRIAGINWYGFETSSYFVQGVDTRSYKEMLQQIKSLGYNVIRLPYTNQIFDKWSTPGGKIDYTKNPDLKGITALEGLDRFIQAAGNLGFRVILDRHRPTATEQSELWYNQTISEDRWISDWKSLAERYKGNPVVVGADLHNEPYGQACWGCGDPARDWRLAAERAGNAILAVNPDWLIIVEGIEKYNDQSYWWGGNLMGAADYPVRLNIGNRLVYSAHDYPPSVSSQPWFNEPNYPQNLPEVWDKFWGYLHKNNIAPVLLGEFGTKLEEAPDGQWLTTLVNYLGTGVKGINWTFWVLNPTSYNTGGILKDNWKDVDTQKQNYLIPILSSFYPPPATVKLPPPTPTR